MAAYAAVLSLMTNIDHIQSHPLHSPSLDKEQIQSLHQIICFLIDFIESYNPHGRSKEEEDLERLIARAAHAGEDVIESHVVDLILAGETRLLDLEGVIQDMDAVKEKVMDFKNTKEFKGVQPLYSLPTTSPKPLTTANNVMVWFDEQLNRVMDRLIGYQPCLQIVPIVGMGGIGKTTLSRNVFKNLCIVENFDIRAWVIISQEYSVENILSEIISYIKRERKKGYGASDGEMYELGNNLHKILWGRRFLIVLDDVWSVDVWDKIKLFLPDNGNSSRVIITTRIWNVATNVSSSSFEMKFLDEDKSWELFSREAFRDEGCPPDLVGVGKKIVRACRGLPLSIVLIGGLLRNSTRTLEYWESFARDINSHLMSGNDEHCLKLMNLSYNHLPAHLKPCFLYMGIYREDEQIRASSLVRAFVAEGFLRPNEVQSLEEVAEDYLEGLVDRNLVLVEGRRWNGRIKYCRMHDVVRDVCLRIGEKEELFCVMRRMHDIEAGMINSKQENLASASLARTFKSNGDILSSKFRLLRVVTLINSTSSLNDIFRQVNLRYLSHDSWHEMPEHLPSSLSRLWNLQTLDFRDVRGRIDATQQIWSMRQLRHLRFHELLVPDPPPNEDDHILPNLQTLSWVVNLSLTEEVCRRIPNITKLKITFTHFSKERRCCYVDRLHKLQSFDCSFFPAPDRGDMLQRVIFPTCLKKLCLFNSCLEWEEVNRIGLSLPHLEFLDLGAADRGTGGEWDSVEGAFPRLRFLQLRRCGLRKWNADGSDFFPVLEHLQLIRLRSLEEIPWGVGGIHTLRYILVDGCRESIAISSTHILREQQCVGNEDLRVEVVFSGSKEQESFMEKVDIHNIQPALMVRQNFTGYFF